MTNLASDIITINPWSPIHSIGSALYGLGFSNESGPASLAWPSANLAIYVPFTLGYSTNIAQVFWHNGTAVSGNVDFGIYSYDGRQLMHTGSTAQATVSVLQIVDITDIFLDQGIYWMAISMDNTTGTLMAAISGLVALETVAGIQQQASAFALPATSTFADCTQDYVPIFGLTARSVL